LREQ
jgi:hypothetical protein